MFLLFILFFDFKNDFKWPPLDLNLLGRDNNDDWEVYRLVERSWASRERVSIVSDSI